MAPSGQAARNAALQRHRKAVADYNAAVRRYNAAVRRWRSIVIKLNG